MHNPWDKKQTVILYTVRYVWIFPKKYEVTDES